MNLNDYFRYKNDLYNDPDFFQSLKQFRKAKKITLVQIATDLHYSKQYISKFEKGERKSDKILLWYLDHGYCLDTFIEGKNYDNSRDNGFALESNSENE